MEQLLNLLNQTINENMLRMTLSGKHWRVDEAGLPAASDGYDHTVCAGNGEQKGKGNHKAEDRASEETGKTTGA